MDFSVCSVTDMESHGLVFLGDFIRLISDIGFLLLLAGCKNVFWGKLSVNDEKILQHGCTL